MELDEDTEDEIVNAPVTTETSESSLHLKIGQYRASYNTECTAYSAMLEENQSQEDIGYMIIWETSRKVRTVAVWNTAKPTKKTEWKAIALKEFDASWPSFCMLAV